jgi:hypothetical protein
MLGAILSGVGSLLSRLSSTRAAYLDKLNLTGKPTDDATWTNTKAGYLDAAISGRAAAADWTSQRAAYLDAAISGRAPDMSQPAYCVGATVNGTDQTVLNISGFAGRLCHIGFRHTATIDAVKINVDGKGEVSLFTSSEGWPSLRYDSGSTYWEGNMVLGIRFKSSCVIRMSGSGSIPVSMVYGRDQ